MYKKVELTERGDNDFIMKIWYNDLNGSFDYYTSASTMQDLFNKLGQIMNEDEEQEYWYELERKILRADYERDKQQEENYYHANMVS